MTDERLRDLERRWKETGSVEDEAAWLKERVRAGDFPPTRLELAAYCGYEAARRAVATQNDPPDLVEWVGGFARFGNDVSARAAVAIAREVFPVWKRCAHAEPTDDFHQALRAAEAWCMEPTADSAARASYVGQCAAGRIDVLPDDVTHEEDAAAAVACWACSAIQDQEASPTAIEWRARAVNQVVRLARSLACDEDLRRRVSREIVPWCLGLDDPLRWSGA
jgi:hypothetical protein